VIGLVGSYVGIYFYLRVIQFLFMSPDAETAGVDSGRSTPLYSGAFARGASLLCLAATLLLSFFPGWMLGRM
jgi:NADH-quinone oxidoreductase subunit N